MLKLGRSIRDNRRAKNLSQQQLADILNVNQSTISSWESGRENPQAEALLKIIDILKIAPILFPDQFQSSVQTLHASEQGGLSMTATERAELDALRAEVARNTEAAARNAVEISELRKMVKHIARNTSEICELLDVASHKENK